MIISLDKIFKDEKFDYILVQGDTTSAFTGALVAFYNKVSVAHIEAGLRTFNKYAPFPEEINRKVTGAIADFHFAPTQQAKQNLLREGIDEKSILVTGNTVIDALLESAKKEDILKNLKITDKDGHEVAVKDVVLASETKSAKFIGDFNQAQSPYLIKYGNDQFKTSMNWQLKDSIYKYDGELGARVSQAGKQVDLTFWSPSADQVDLVVYDKEDQNKVIGRLAMQKEEKSAPSAPSQLGLRGCHS